MLCYRVHIVNLSDSLFFCPLYKYRMHFQNQRDSVLAVELHCMNFERQIVKFASKIVLRKLDSAKQTKLCMYC